MFVQCLVSIMSYLDICLTCCCRVILVSESSSEVLFDSARDGVDTMTEQQARMRRHSMENLELVKITPDKVRQSLLSSLDKFSLLSHSLYGKVKIWFYIAQYPVRWTDRTLYTSPPGRPTGSFRQQHDFSGKHSTKLHTARRLHSHFHSRL